MVFNISSFLKVFKWAKRWAFSWLPLLSLFILSLHSQAVKSPNSYDFVFRVLQYKGGGDWYEGKVGVLELMDFVNQHDIFSAYPTYQIVEISSSDLYQNNFLYMTGHGNWEMTSIEVSHLKKYLSLGGFLFINDDYGIHNSVIREIKKIFPDKKWVTVPSEHPIYNIYYDFRKGAPKIHKHDGGTPEVYGLYHDGKMVVFYVKNADIGDGWAPYQVHKNDESLRKRALQFGFNIILYSMVR